MSANKGPVSEQDLHLNVGAYDEVHHAHGYAHIKEKHHWYWFAGIGVGIVSVIGAIFVYTQIEVAAPPFCERIAIQDKTSPDGSHWLEVAEVSCLGGATEQKIFMGQTDGTTKLIAAFDNKASIRVRWISDTEVVITQSDGKIWFFQPKWKTLKIKYVS
jgi:hypothetical protein